MGIFRRTERRNNGGDFYSTVLRTVELEAATKSADSAATAAVEAAAGLLGRELAQATVKGTDALTAPVLRQIGRDLVRPGASLHRIDTTRGRLRLLACGEWHWHSGRGADPDTWTVKATEFGPSGTLVYDLPAAAVLYLDWAHNASTPWAGKGALDWAALTARVNANAERSLGKEMNGNVAQLVVQPKNVAASGTDADGNPTTNPVEQLAKDVAGADGRTVYVETVNADGRAEAPQYDWKPQRLGPQPPAEVAEIARDAFARVLSAFGVPAGLFVPDADGTAQRESLRRYRMNVVEPTARLIEHEARVKLEADVSLTFDGYALDLAGRAQAFQKLVAGGTEVERALALTGLLSEEP